jgi:hypothetical protein
MIIFNGIASVCISQSLPKAYWMALSPAVIYTTNDVTTSNLEHLKRSGDFWAYHVPQQDYFTMNGDRMYYKTVLPPVHAKLFCMKYGIGFNILYPKPLLDTRTFTFKSYFAYREAFTTNKVVVVHHEQRVRGSDTIMQVVSVPLSSISSHGQIDEIHVSFLQRNKGKWVNLLYSPPHQYKKEEIMPPGGF